ncbi:MAG TPA: GNAT family N-acetyltransferase [Patescibacteria group bacterium]|nr:GNAT family N-acetyltransferase [Patescibacteria group bacterium]
MANGNQDEIIREEDRPPGLDYLYSSFFDLHNVEPPTAGSNLLQLKQQNITVRIETDLETCHQLFEEFSPKRTLFELWGFRYAFYLGDKNQPVFLIFERDNEPLGLLPLWYEKDKDELRWFGSWWQEGNTFWLKEKSLIPIIFSLFPQKVLLNAIYVSPRTAKKFGLLADDPKFLLSLDEYPNLETFLQKFDRKKRYNLKRDQRLILAKNPQTVYNRFKDIKKLFDLSIKRFQDLDESAFVREERREAFREIIKQTGEYEARMVSTEINGKVVGTDLVCIHKGVYYALNGAYDLKRHPGLGNYTNLLLIQDAINLGAKAVDFLEVSYGWKEDWFKPIPLFQFNGFLEKKVVGLGQ